MVRSTLNSFAHFDLLQDATTEGWFDQLIISLALGCQETPGIGTGVLTDPLGWIAETVAVTALFSVPLS